MSLLVDGCVRIIHTSREAGAVTVKTLAELTPLSERPWFGEVILWMDAPLRAGDALCTEVTLVFELDVSKVCATLWERSC